MCGRKGYAPPTFHATAPPTSHFAQRVRIVPRFPRPPPPTRRRGERNAPDTWRSFTRPRPLRAAPFPFLPDMLYGMATTAYQVMALARKRY